MANAASTVLAPSKQIASDIGSYGINKITDAYLEGMSAAEKEAFAKLSPKDQYTALAGFDSSYPGALVTQQKANSASPACQAFVNAAASYKYGSWPGELGLFDDLGRSSEALSSFAHSMNGRAYRELIFENGGLQPVYILPQEYTVAALAQWSAGVDTSIDQYGLWSKETAGEVGLGLAQLLARRYGMVNIVGGNRGFGSGRSDGTPNTSSGTQVLKSVRVLRFILVQAHPMSCCISDS